MAKLDIHSRARARRRQAAAVLALAGTVCFTAEAARMSAHARGEFAPGPARPLSSWRVSTSGGTEAGSALLPAARTWTLHGPVRGRSPARLTIRCGAGGKLSAYVQFPGRDWVGGSVLHYRFGHRPPRRRPSRAERSGAVERLGGPEIVSEIVRAKVLEVAIDDIGFGVSEAVFVLTGVDDAVRRIEGTCREPAPASPRPSAPRGAETAPGDRPQRAAAAERPRSRPVPSPAAKPTPRASQRSGPDALPSRQIEPDPSKPVGEPPPPPAPEPPAAPAPPERKAEPAQPEPADPEPKQDAGGTDASKAAPGHATETPIPTPLPRGDGPSGTAGVAAFLQKYGPNRKGEPIYDWYKRCLAHAGVDGEQVWYLSSEELTYLSKGETDQVRLSMLISTTRDPDQPPRRITCFGTARGKEITIDRTE